MKLREVTLADRFDLKVSPVLLNGSQAMVRLLLIQAARDRAAGHRTAGFVTGYRGSPLGGVDVQMHRAERELRAADIVFQEGLNEDLAATALWGTQQAHLRGEGTHDGVFGLWYGKGPGVDRSGDAMRHANLAGTAPLGGVIMAMGDDHTGEASTTCHQSELAMVDAHIPVLSPAGVQEILDFGLYGYALGRYAGVWAGLKLMKDTVESTAVVDGRSDRLPEFTRPDQMLPEDGLNIRLGDHWVPQEERLLVHKRAAIDAFAAANRIDGRKLGRNGATVGFVAAGKNWLDLTHAMDLLGIDEAAAERLGITTYKIGQTWPLEATGVRDWAEGLDLIIVVEEKRKLIEAQVKDILFDRAGTLRVQGGHRNEDVLFPAHSVLSPVQVALRLGEILTGEGRSNEQLAATLGSLREAQAGTSAAELAARLPYFCAGCPHNTSTRVPDGSRAGAGIGCHTMALWMDRSTEGYTHMGAEGMNWAGESKFSTRRHVFQNLGDGTYNHSGLQAIRGAIAAGTTITYKILYNDAVAMTGGQKNDGGLTAPQICRELLSIGVDRVELVYDPLEPLDLKAFPSGIGRHERDDLETVQKSLSETEGVTALVFVQTCAAEKRRRRKRGAFPEATMRVFIDPAVCEGCGDCGVQSNCVAIVPVETSFGRKRAVDQSACNSDFSCLKGFCPSFVTVEGAVLRKDPAKPLTLPTLPEPELPPINGTFNIVLTGVGGTGVVTVGAAISMAAHLQHGAAGMMEMAGMAQKGGAVHIHCRIADAPEDISAVRVAPGEIDLLIGGDLVVSAGRVTQSLLRRGRSAAVVNTHETPTGAFTRDPDFRLPAEAMRTALEAQVGERLYVFDSTELARQAMGDSLYSNMMLLGAAWQRGLVPISSEAILRAVELNGVAVENNKRAFEIGRWAGADPEALATFLEPETPVIQGLDDRIALWANHLTTYQSARLAKRFRAVVDPIEDVEVRETVAFSYQKLLAYKDEYEVARLLRDTDKRVSAEFDGDLRLTHHLAPPFLSRTGPDGRPAKRTFGAATRRMFPFLASMKMLRGTFLDPFGRSEERRLERKLIAQFEDDVKTLLPEITPANRETVLQILKQPAVIKGFGPVKLANAEKAARARAMLLEKLKSPDAALAAAAE